MKADPADCFGKGEDACLYGFVLARGVHLRIHPGDFHGSRGLYAQARAKLEQLVQVLWCQPRCFSETRLLRNSGAKSAPFGQQTVRSSGST
jgi:hypothetical protein